MLHRFLIFFSITILISACYGNKKPKKPENLISKKDMVNILIDIRIMASATGKNRQKLDELGIHQDDYIYKKHNIDSLQFASSNAYYSYFMVEYESIYSKVNDSLTRLKELYRILNEREIEEKRIQDSIAKLTPKDSIDKLSEKENNKEVVEEIGGLIEPVSETVLQPR